MSTYRITYLASCVSGSTVLLCILSSIICLRLQHDMWLSIIRPCGKMICQNEQIERFSRKAQNNYDNLDVSWKTSILCGSPRPSWSRMTQFVHHGDHAGKASVMFLHIIHMDSSDTTCIYSNLVFVTEHAPPMVSTQSPSSISPSDGSLS